ncbi:MAG: helix-turn-helix transcriptional regulator [Rhodospirillales bacterium]|nr:helix-turn-helix transcriptional regulator [Rhodospirillales bacterium]
MFISLEQIKAARALLKWTQKDLAAHAGLGDDQVHSYEAGRTRSLEVLEAMCAAFAAHGIDFPDGGVQPRKVSSYLLNSYMDLLDDISRSMPEGGEVLKHCVDDRRSTPEVVEKVSQMRRAGIRERLTISEENNYVSGDPKDYRQIPSGYFASSEVMIIYLNKVAFFVEGKALVIVSESLAKVFRDQFEYWWKEGKALRGT